MHRTFGLLMAVVLVVIAIHAGQIDTEWPPSEQDAGDLYSRVSASRFVVVGTVVKSGGVSKRLSASDIEKMTRLDPQKQTAVVSLTDTYGGPLFTVRVEETLCRHTDLEIGTTVAQQVPDQPGPEVYLFVPRNEEMWIDGHQKEYLLENHRYLLFLVEPHHSKQTEWTNVFELDRNRTYYRTEERARGVVELSNTAADVPGHKSPPLLERTVRLCQAIRPATLTGKLMALKKLAASEDALLAKEAEVAAVALQSDSASHGNIPPK